MVNKILCVLLCCVYSVHAQEKNVSVVCDDDIFVDIPSDTKKNKQTMSDVKEQCARVMKESMKSFVELQKTILDAHDILLQKVEELVDDIEPSFFSESTKKEIQDVTKKISDLQSFVQDATLDIEQKTFSLFKKNQKIKK